MAFAQINQSESRAKREQAVLEFWKEIGLFERSAKQNEGGPEFVFFEGPPTANGRPGIHHVLSRVFKDIYVRFYMQRGYHVPRRAGWDCHGLPVEREVEKALGISTKSQIEEQYGVARFNELCRESVLKYVAEWSEFSERMAFSVDLEDAYYTMDNEFIESVWSLLKLIWEKGLIYQGYKVVPCDPVLGATMSDAEVDQGYREIEDPSLTVRFRVADDRFSENTSLLVWTTTPWTLPSNTALAVSPEEEYVLVKYQQETGAAAEQLICAKALYDSVFAAPPPPKKQAKSGKKGDDPEQGPVASIVRTLRGSELAGVRYRQLLDHAPKELFAEKDCFYVVCADFVTMDTGTGIVHIAPAYGADDLEVGLKHDLPVVHAVGLDGRFIAGTPHAGVFFKDADKEITKELKAAGLVFRSERYRHNYPFGYRTGAPLIYYAKDAWYIRTTSLKEELLKNNESIRWVPPHIKHGRFGNWLENNRDWALSRERFWGTPLPVWSDGEGNFRIIGSVAELEQLSGRKLADLDLHRPHVDEITFSDPESGRTMSRVPEVIDCWFDSGAMPYSQWGWPVRGAEQFQRYFPADFISEAIDQTRGWFYTLLAIGTMVSNQSPYRNVVCLGHVLDEKGEKMSKSKGNVVDPFAVFESHGADAIRWHFLTAAAPGHSRRVGQPGSKDDPVAGVHGFLNMLVNSVGFFVMYANVDQITIDGDWQKNPIKGAPDFAKRPEIDRWILSALQDLIRDCTEALADYDCQRAGRLVEEFVDGLSNWYIRRNRRRFWKGELDTDKLSAYDTLYRSLVAIVSVIAPFTPFLAEELYQVLVAKATSQAPESVHLAGWPKADHEALFDQTALAAGDVVKRVAYLGRAARMQSGLKVRQPLARLMVHLDNAALRPAIQENAIVLGEELNVKQIEFLEEQAGIIEYRIKPNLPRLGPRLGSRLRDLKQALEKADAQSLARKARAGEPIMLATTSGEDIELEPEDLLVDSVSREGTSGAEEAGILVALDTTLTPELIAEGVARDLVRNVQELRKTSGLEVTDRIRLSIQGEGERLQSALQGFSEFIESETLARLENPGPSTKADGERRVDLEGQPVRIVLWKA